MTLETSESAEHDAVNYSVQGLSVLHSRAIFNPELRNNLHHDPDQFPGFGSHKRRGQTKDAFHSIRTTHAHPAIEILPRGKRPEFDSSSVGSGFHVGQ